MAQITISDYDNLPLNNFEKYDKATNKWVPIYGPEVERWYTTNVITRLPNGVRIGRVDHFTKHSMKRIIDSVIRQIVKREGLPGEYIVEFDLSDKIYDASAVNRQIAVKITA